MTYVFILFLSIMASFGGYSNLYSHSQKFDSESCGLLKDRIAGAFFGAAIGDALGRLTEFMPSLNDIHKKFGREGITSFFPRMEVYNPLTSSNVVPYTDDTVMALELAKVFLEGRQQSHPAPVMLEKLARIYVHMLGKNRYAFDPLFNIRAHGNQNIKAVSKLEWMIFSGIANKNPLWWQRYDASCETRYCKEVAQEGGCGSVMRAWPIGIIFADNMTLIKDLADKQSMITHCHPIARAASVALAVGVAQALLQKSPDEVAKAMIAAAHEFDERELLYKPKAKIMSEEDQLTSDMIAHDRLLTGDMLQYAYLMAKEGKVPEYVLGTHNDKQANNRSKTGALLGWSADEAVAAALYIFIRNPDDLRAALIEGANTPGDSDSIASLAGALVGARTGIQLLHCTNFEYGNLENIIGISTLVKSIHDTLAVELLKKGICA